MKWHHCDGARRIQIYEADRMRADDGVVQLLNEDLVGHLAVIAVITLAPGQSVSLMDKKDVELMEDRKKLPHAHM